MMFSIKIRKIGSTSPFERHIIDKPTLLGAVAEAIERFMLKHNEPIICGAVVPFDDYEFQARRVAIDEI